MNNKVVLVIGAALIAFGVFKPDLSSLLPTPGVVVNTPSVEVTEPTDPTLKSLALDVAQILKNGDDSRKEDGVKLASLYTDIANLISLDKDNEVVKTTSEITEVNSVAGRMMNLKIKGKYADLTETARKLVVSAIGDDVAVLNDASRSQAVAAFRALAWGCYEGAK